MPGGAFGPDSGFGFRVSGFEFRFLVLGFRFTGRGGSRVVDKRRKNIYSVEYAGFVPPKS